LLVVAGAIAAVFLEQIVRVTGVTGVLYRTLNGVSDRFNLPQTSTTALTAVTRDVMVVGIVAMLCLAVSLTLFMIYSYSTDDEDAGSILPPRGGPDDTVP
jgi:hypothetical protein